MQLIVNGANGHRGVPVPKLVTLEIKPGKEQLLSMQARGVVLALENQFRPNNAIPNHVPSIVSGVNGVLGVNVPKVVMEEINRDIVP